MEQKIRSSVRQHDKEEEKKMKDESVVENYNPDVLSSQTSHLPPEILMVIFHFVSTCDLVSCRRVCRSWRPVATFLYRRRTDNKKQFHYDTTLLCYLETRWRRNGERRSLSEFNDLLKAYPADALEENSNLLPFTGFNFEIPLQLQAQEMREFLDLYGTRVLHLYISVDKKYGMDNSDKIPRLVRQLLLGQMPNVVQLELCPSLSHSKSSKFTPTPISPEISDSLTLGKLRTLEICRFTGSSGLVADILKNAPNLKECNTSSSYSARGFPLHKFDLFRDTGKVVAVTEAALDLTEWNLEQLEKTVGGDVKLRLKKLSISLQLSNLPAAGNFKSKSQSQPSKIHIRFASLLNKILERNQNHLESLELLKPIGFLGTAGLQIPVLSRLKTLKLYCKNESREGGGGFLKKNSVFPCLHGGTRRCSSWEILSPVFPPALELSSSFPNLTEVVLDLDLGPTDPDSAEENWNKYFPKEETEHIKIPTVVAVRLQNSSVVPVLKRISDMFPNCRNLHIDFQILNPSFFTFAGAGFWNNFQLVENLELTLSFDYIMPQDGQEIDSFFTGFSEERIKRLMEMDVEELRKIPRAEIDTWRQNPSILQLKKLRRLLLCFQKWGLPLMKETPRLSKVSGVFAFEMMEMNQCKIGHQEPFSVKIMSWKLYRNWIASNFVSPYSISIG